MSLPRVSRVVSGRRGGDTQRPRPPVSSVQRSLQDTAHTSLVSGGVLSGQSKRVQQAEGRWPHLVRQFLLESMEASEGVLKLAAILLAGQPTHPAPCRSHRQRSHPSKIFTLLTLHSELLVGGGLDLGAHCPVSGHGQWRLARKLPVRSGQANTCQVQWTSSPHCSDCTQ